MGAYLSLRSINSHGMGGLFSAAHQWTKTWKLRYFTEQEGWSWYKASNVANDENPQIFEGNEDASGIKFVSLPKPIKASRLRLHPVEWHQHAALRCEIHVATKVELPNTGDTS